MSEPGDDTSDALELARKAAAVDRSDPSAPGIFELALTAADAALSLAPENALARLGRAVVLSQLGREEDAIRELDEAIASRPDFKALYTARGRLLERRGELSRALADYESAVALTPRDATAHRDLGDARLALGDRDGALEAYDDALELDPGYVEVYRIRAAELLLHGKAPEAVRNYEQVIALGAGSGPAYRDLGNALAAAGDRGAAIDAFTHAIAIDDDLTDAYIGRAQAYGHGGAPEDAIADYTRALEIDPSLVKAYRARGRQRLLVGDLEGAVEDLTRAMALGDPGPDTSYARGRALAKLGRYQPAVDDFDAAIEADPQFADAYLARAEAHAVLHDADLALRDFEALIALDPRSARGYVGRGEALLSLGDPEKALWDFDRALALEPERIEAHRSRVEAWSVLAETYGRRQLPKHQRKAYVSTLEAVERALSLAPGDPTFHFYRAAVLQSLCAFDGAVEAALEGVRAAPKGDGIVPQLHRVAADALRQWADALHLPERFEESLRQLDEAERAAGGTDPQLEELRGQGLVELGRGEEALERFAAAERSAPDQVRAYLGHAKAYLQLGRPEEAIRVLEPLVAPAWEGHIWAHWAHAGRAVGFAITGDTERRAAELENGGTTASDLVVRASALDYFEALEDAAAELRTAIERDTGSPVARNALAWLIADRMESSPEMLHEARQLADEAVELEGLGLDRANYLDTAGFVARRLERHHEAVAQLRRAFELDPYHLVIRSHLAEAERALGVAQTSTEPAHEPA